MIEVRDSHIHGKGLFARTTITEGTLIGEVQGKPVEADGPHVLWIEEGVSAIEVENEFRFINHDKDPNAAYYDDLTVVALRDIEHGEEITHNYGEDWDAPVATEITDSSNN